jgi:hypothetical protein
MPEQVGSRPDAGAPGSVPERSGGSVPGAVPGAVARGTSDATGDWAKDTTDRLDQLIATVRAQTTDRLVGVARLLVFGLLAAVMGLMALVLVVAALVRALDELIPQEVWLTYLILGAIFTAVGLFLWSKKERPPSKA